MATALDRDTDELSAELVDALSVLGQVMGRDLAEADWWRLLDGVSVRLLSSGTRDCVDPGQERHPRAG